MMTNLLLTVTVPAYNIEAYIERCVQSFVAVSPSYYNLFELLVVNDGSKDRTAELVQQLQQQYPELNLQLIDKENGGHGSTINVGMDLAKGKYFKVIDGDDWVDSLAFEQLLDRLHQTDVDMVLTDFTHQYVLDNSTKLSQPENLPVGQEVKLADVKDQRFYMHALVYKTSLLQEHNIRLSEGVFYVDIQYVYFPLQYVDSLVYYPLDVYQYFLGRIGQSVAIDSFKRNIKHHLLVTGSILETYERVPNHLKKKYDIILQALVKMQLLLTYMVNDPEDEKELYRLLKNHSYNYTVPMDSKVSALLYANLMTKGKLEWLLMPLARRKLAQIEENW